MTHTLGQGQPPTGPATILWTSLAMAAFAGNSLLCRMALGRGLADAASFSALRLLAGAAVLWLIMYGKRPQERTGAARLAGSWTSALALFAYAVPFSFAYSELTTGTGALLLFGSVQLTMMLAALAAGERPALLQWLGLAAAMGGFVHLVLPGLAAPPLLPSALMAVAGVSWGVYSLRGRRTESPLIETGGNFARSVPFALLLVIVFNRELELTAMGALLAITAGALTSGIGYAIWYAALEGLTATRAAVVQLSVPVLATAAGTLFLGEGLTPRLIVASVTILGGVGLSLGANRPAKS